MCASAHFVPSFFMPIPGIPHHPLLKTLEDPSKLKLPISIRHSLLVHLINIKAFIRQEDPKFSCSAEDHDRQRKG